VNRRPLDVITMGRSSVDLYAEQVGGPLEDVQTFAKYVGGCPTNIAIGSARLGLRSAVITRVGDEQMGRFIRRTLEDEGVDVSHVSTDPVRLTALVILGIRSMESFPHIFYRTDCADMAITPEHVDREFIASATALLISGTHLSRPNVEAASLRAVAHARDAGTRVVFDIDYRPVLWGLTSAQMGESRFVADSEVTARLQRVLADCDLVVGTEEEIHIAGGSADTITALRNIRALTDATLIVKSGPQGCWRFPAAIGDSLQTSDHSRGFPVEVFNTLGAGDGFMSGLLRGWLRDETLARACEFANACGALVVARHGCAPAMPTWEELEEFLRRDPTPARPREDERLEHLHRVTTRARAWPEVHALAFDHRSQLESLAEECGAERALIPLLKRHIAAGARDAMGDSAGAGAIVDARYGAEVLAELTGTEWWLARPVEQPGSRPLEFEAGANIGLSLRTWPREQIAKCLVFYHPDDEASLKRQQLDQLHQLYRACVETGHELMIEVLPPPAVAFADGDLPRALAEFYVRGIRPDWWKLQPDPTDTAWAAVAAIIQERDAHCRGVVLLGLDAAPEILAEHFRVAARQSVCKGFAVGRSIFKAPAQAWLRRTIDDAELRRQIADNYRRFKDLWRT
jgi:5-dehydro-2-deoxygluconokinase